MLRLAPLNPALSEPERKWVSSPLHGRETNANGGEFATVVGEAVGAKESEWKNARCHLISRAYASERAGLQVGYLQQCK